MRGFVRRPGDATMGGMTFSPLLEELYLAKKGRKSGQLRVQAFGKESQVHLRLGDGVGLDMAFGYQNLPQSLVQHERLPLAELDALWKEGTPLSPNGKWLEARGLSPREADFAFMLANLRQLSRLSGHVFFEEGQREDAPGRVDGGFLLVALLAELPLEVGARRFRCSDTESARLWGRTVEDAVFLDSLDRFRSFESVTPSQRGLLHVLFREGLLIEELEAEDMIVELEMSDVVSLELTDIVEVK